MKNHEAFCDYGLYKLSCGGLEVTVTGLGATVLSIELDGRELVLGYDDPKGYLDGNAYICAAVGRYANRIAKARFSLNGAEHSLSANEGVNQLHGGNEGMSYSKRRWKGSSLSESSVKFALVSPSGDNGFPGELTACMSYTVTKDALRIDFEGECSEDTVFAPTSHLYFNLDNSDSILGTKLRINAEQYVEVGEDLIPTGRLLATDGRFDFKKLRPIASDFDHCFALSGEHACTAACGGVQLDIYTDYPGLQLYTGKFLEKPFGRNGGFALEPEFFPNSPNVPQFEAPILKAGEHFHKYAIYKFTHTTE